jgi:hypothetical protein
VKALAMCRLPRGTARTIGMALTVAVGAGCTPAAPPPATAEPWPGGLEIIWDIEDSTETGGRGPYFTAPSAPRLHDGPVFVAWSCSGNGVLGVVPAIVAHDGAPPPATSPLAFQLLCPTAVDGNVLSWKELAVEAEGGENLVQIRSAIQPSTPVQYRVVFAQPPNP